VAPDPASWLAIEHGWEVVDAEGERVGTVHELVGDTTSDIFNGLAISTGPLKRNVYVPSEQVGAIEAGTVHLTLTGSQADELRPFDEPPPSEQFLAP